MHTKNKYMGLLFVHQKIILNYNIQINDTK